MKSTRVQEFVRKALILSLLLISLADVVFSHCAMREVVQTNNGRIRGVFKQTLIEKVNYFSFKGIPYAKSPTGELRFEVSFWIFFFGKM